MKFFIKNKITYIACCFAIFLTACGGSDTSGTTSCKVDDSCDIALFAIQDNLETANKEVLKTDSYSTYRLDILTTVIAEADVVLANFIDNQLDVTTSENQVIIVETVALLENALNTLTDMKPRGDCGLYSCENDYIVYFVNAGDDSVDSLEEDNKLGVYQTFTDQIYGEDPITRMYWGLATDAVSASVRDNTTILGTLNYYSGDQIDGKAIAYDFELPEGHYELKLGFLNPWDERAINVYAEGMLISQENLVLTKNKEIILSYLNIEVLDGTLNIVIQGPTGVDLTQQNDPLINTIVIKDYMPVEVDDLSTSITEATTEAAKTDVYHAYRISQLEAAITEATVVLNDFIDNSLDASTSENQVRLIAAIASLGKVVDTLLDPIKAIEDLTAVSTEAPVVLNWVTPGFVSTSAKVFRAEAVSEGDTPDVDNRVEITSLVNGETTWTDDTSVPGHTYHYWVDVVDTEGNSVQSNAVFAEYVLVEVLELDAIYVNNTIEITWKLAFKDMTTIEIYRNTIDGDTGRTRVFASAPAEGTFIDNAPAFSSTAPGPALPGVDYWYTIKLVLADGTRPTMPRIPATIPVGGGDPILGTYSELNAEQTEINVGWSVSSVDIASIEIFRDENEEGLTRTSVATPAATDISWVDDTAVDGVFYTYWVEITDTDGTLYTPTQTSAIEVPLIVLEPETNLVASSNGTKVTVTWDLKNFSFDIGNAYIELYRNNTNGTGGRTRVVKAATPTGTFIDEGTVDRPIEIGATYWYMFKIIPAAGDGDRVDTTPEAEITISDLPDGTNLTAVWNGTSVDVTWELRGFSFDVENAYIELYRNNTNGTGGRTRVVKTATPSGTFTDEGTVERPIESGGTYWYMFKIIPAAGDGDRVDTVPEAEITIPEIPDGTNLTAVWNGTSVDVTWNLKGFSFDIENAYIELYRNNKNETGGRTRIVKEATPSGTFTDEGTVERPIESGGTYWYMFKIIPAAGDGDRVDTDPEMEITIP
ncbi:MAG: hypothetical protein OCD00_08125 [Colwellia sp.]